MRVVVIGGGIAGLTFAKHASEFADVILVEPKDFMVCQALLPELLSGKVDVEDLCVSIEEFCDCFGVEHVKERAVGIENGAIVTEKKEVECDFVAIAVGAETNYYGIEGAERTFNVNTLEDTLKAKKALDNAEDVVVVGSGLTGVEVALELAELGYGVKIVEAMKRILPTFSQKVSNFVYKIMIKEGIDVNTSTTVVRIEEDGVVTNRGRICCDLVMWCAGLKPSEFVRNLNVPKERGWVKVDETLKANGFFAFGDCAHVEVNGEVATKTALEARSQAKHSAENLKRMLRDDSPKPYRIRSSVDRPIAMIMLARGRAIMIYRGLVMTKPMGLIYRMKKWAIERFLGYFRP